MAKRCTVGIMCFDSNVCTSISRNQVVFFPKAQTASSHPLPDVSGSCGSTGSSREDVKTNVAFKIEPKAALGERPFPSFLSYSQIVIPILRHSAPNKQA